MTISVSADRGEQWDLYFGVIVGFKFVVEFHDEIACF